MIKYYLLLILTTHIHRWWKQISM